MVEEEREEENYKIIVRQWHNTMLPMRMVCDALPGCCSLLEKETEAWEFTSPSEALTPKEYLDLLVRIAGSMPAVLQPMSTHGTALSYTLWAVRALKAVEDTRDLSDEELEMLRVFYALE